MFFSLSMEVSGKKATDRSSSFYRPSAYALAQVVVDVPLVFIQVVLFDLVVYLYDLPGPFFFKN